MTLSAVLLLVIMCCFTGTAAVAYWAGKRSGQFEDIEGIKYRMLDDDPLES